MAKTTVIIHLPVHRRLSIKHEGDTHEAVAAYDHHIGDYIRFLQAQATKAGFELRTDQHEAEHVFSIEEISHDDKKAAHDWLESEPDLWNWIP
jgi:hypothetical protein